MDQDLNFGGILSGFRKFQEAMAWVDKLGIDVKQAQDLLPAIVAFQSAATTDEKLTAAQAFLREFSQVTTKTLLDDQASAIIDQVLVPPLRGFVVSMLDKALASSVQEPGLVLSMELPDEALSQELQLQQIEWEKWLNLLMQLVALFKSLR